MNAKSKIYILIVVILIVLVAVLDTKVPKPMNWNERYNIKGNMPFDLKILYRELEGYKKWNSFENIGQSFYQYSNEKFSDSLPSRHLVIYIGNDFEIDDQSEKALLDFISHGNDLFISTKNIHSFNFEFLPFKFVNNYFVNNRKFYLGLIHTTIYDSLEKLSSYTYITPKENSKGFTQLGYIKLDDEMSKNNFSKLSYGKGNIYIHTSPFIFSNYYLLYVNQTMAETIFSSLDNTNAYFLTDINKHKKSTNTHLLQFIFQNETLTWAWYISLSALLVFMSFNAKRRQRIIPIQKPLENTTIAFTHTISNMFYETKDHDFIAEKRINYFLDYIRNRYHLTTENLTKEFIDTLSKRSGVSISTTELLIGFINKFNKNKNIPESQLIHLDRLLEQFKNEEHSFTQKIN